MCSDVFLISIDCLRPDYLGVYNPSCEKLPLIDALADGAAVFTQAITHAPFTTPAIASLLTGVYPFRTGVRLLVGQSCDPTRGTIAEYARRAGFVTGGFPSVFILNSDTGLGRGFDCYRDITEGIMSGRGGCWQTGDHLNEVIDQFLTDAGRSRVFCWVHYFDLHDYHLDKSVPVQTSYTRDLRDRIDRGCVGELMTILRRHHRDEEAAIILTADHGESLMQHGQRGHGHHLYDSVLRVPLIWRWGNLTSSVGPIRDQVRLVDVLPTLLELWGIPCEDWPRPLDGRSLVPLLTGRAMPGNAGDTDDTDDTGDTDDIWASASYAEASPRQLFEGDIKAHKVFAGPEQQSIRTGRHKFILHEDGRRELYDLLGDPLELHDLADSHKQDADDLASALADLTGQDTACFSQTAYTPAEEAQVLHRLRELGYVS